MLFFEVGFGQCRTGPVIINPHSQEEKNESGIYNVEEVNKEWVALPDGRGNEDRKAAELAARCGYRGMGGSDAHIVTHIGRCATRFESEIRTEEDLVRELKGDRFEAIRWA